MSNPNAPVTAGALALATRRKTTRLGRTFAGSLATRLDAHPTTAEGDRAADERRILKLIEDVLAQPDPDPCAVNFITHAVEVHTREHGFSKPIYDRVFELHQSRVAKRATRLAAAPAPASARTGAANGATAAATAASPSAASASASRPGDRRLLQFSRGLKA